MICMGQQVEAHVRAFNPVSSMNDSPRPRVDQLRLPRRTNSGPAAMSALGKFRRVSKGGDGPRVVFI